MIITFTYPRGTVITFPIGPDQSIYEALKCRLFTRRVPSDIQFNLHMLALAGQNYKPPYTRTNILSILKMKGLLAYDTQV